MQPFALVDRDFTADIQLGLAPHRPLKTFAIKFAPGDLFHDNVRNFMKKHSIPAYLELSILSTVGTLYERSVQKHREDRLGHDADLDLQAMKEGRRAFIDCYEEHTQEFHNSSAQVQSARRKYACRRIHPLTENWFTGYFCYSLLYSGTFTYTLHLRYNPRIGTELRIVYKPIDTSPG